MYDSRGNQVGYSGSWDNSYEIAEFAANPGETYTIKIRRWSGTADVWYGVAWSVQGTPLIRPNWDLEQILTSSPEQTRLENWKEAWLPRVPMATPSMPPQASIPENDSTKEPRPVARTRRVTASPLDGVTRTRTRSRAWKPVPLTFSGVMLEGARWA